MRPQMFEFEMWQIARGAVNAWTRTLDASMHVLNLVLVLYHSRSTKFSLENTAVDLPTVLESTCKY